MQKSPRAPYHLTPGTKKRRIILRQACYCPPIDCCYLSGYTGEYKVSLAWLGDQVFRHKGLQQFHQTGDSSKVIQSQVKRLRIILTLLSEAVGPEDMAFPGSGLHPLKVQRAGYWAVKVTGNRRIIFRFDRGDVFDVDYLDYH